MTSDFNKMYLEKLKADLDIFGLPKSTIYAMREEYHSVDFLTTEEEQAACAFKHDLLLDYMCIKDASPAELERAIKFGYVILDCIEYKLVLSVAYLDLEIGSLYSKYMEVK